MSNHLDNVSVRLVIFCQSGGTEGVLRGVLAPACHCSGLIENPLADKAGWENDLSIVQVATKDLTKSTILRILLVFLTICQPYNNKTCCLNGVRFLSNLFMSK